MLIAPPATPRQVRDMRNPSMILLLAACFATTNCGPTPRGDVDSNPGGSADAPPMGPPGGVRGRVWAPGLNPAVAGAQAIPVAGASVYIVNSRPQQIPSGAYCEPCQATPTHAVQTDATGNFLLPQVPPGRHYLVIQKAQFRLEEIIDIESNIVLNITEEQGTLPSKRDYAAGKTVPHIAIATGGYDHLENILGKMGMGAIDGNGTFTMTFADIDIYSNGGSDYGQAAGTLESLVRDAGKMRQYHIIFIPCSGDSFAQALQDQTVLRNIRDFVKAGGKLYVTDWSGEWMDNVFPAQIELGSAFGGIGPKIDTPASAYNRANDSWSTGSFGNADGDAYDSSDANVLDAKMAAWLGAQQSPTPDNSAPAAVNAHHFKTVDNWNWIKQLNAVPVGNNAQGMPVIDTPKAWVNGSNPLPIGGGGATKHPLTVTFEPAGCGRVLYSTYHTTDSQHTGLFPQERILLYLMMEIGVCSDNPVVE
jgi:hypothetical protein